MPSEDQRYAVGWSQSRQAASPAGEADSRPFIPQKLSRCSCTRYADTSLGEAPFPEPRLGIYCCRAPEVSGDSRRKNAISNQCVVDASLPPPLFNPLWLLIYNIAGASIASSRERYWWGRVAGRREALLPTMFRCQRLRRRCRGRRKLCLATVNHRRPRVVLQTTASAGPKAVVLKDSVVNPLAQIRLSRLRLERILPAAQESASIEIEPQRCASDTFRGGWRPPVSTFSLGPLLWCPRSILPLRTGRCSTAAMLRIRRLHQRAAMRRTSQQCRLEFGCQVAELPTIDPGAP